MRRISLKEAAVEIRQAVDQGASQKLGSPFFFMVGAGISSPPIPLASGVEAHCREEAQKYGKDALPPSSGSIDSYSWWFEQAYPQAVNRQHYLRGLIEKAFISRANFRLAHLLLESTISNLVVTTNFDDFLSRALTLFGQRHIVSDHPKTLERIDRQSKDIQIVQIHGSFWYYDCCNLKGELKDRAKPSNSTSFTMLSLLDDILRQHSPLVVGYSGWEGDVFMTALERRLSAPLGTNLYWFCYRESDSKNLPEWLQDQSNVVVVVPEAPISNRSTQADGLGGSSLTGDYTIQIKGGEANAASKMEGGEPRLQATSVFDELITTFDLKAPPLTQDPITFLAKHLRKAMWGDGEIAIEDDVYALNSVIERLEKAAVQQSLLPASSQAEELLESFRNAVRQSKDKDAIDIAARVPRAELSALQAREISSALVDVARSLNDSSEEELSCYDQILLLTRRIEDLSQLEIADEERAAKALVAKGITQGALSRSEEAIAVYDEVMRRFGEGSESALREQVARALVNKGATLDDLNRSEEAITVYDEVVQRFGEDSEAVLREGCARALVNKGITLGARNCSEEEIAVYDEVLRRFGEASEAALREQVAIALVNKGCRLGALNRSEEAIAVYDEVVRRFGEASEAALREKVAMALVNKGVRLGALNRSEEAIAVYDEVVRRFGEASEAALRERVAKALFNKGITLGALDRSEEEIAVYDEVVRRFGEASEAALREQVAMALVYKGITLGALNRGDEAIAVYDEVVRRFGEASEAALRERVAQALVNKGVRLGALNRGEEAIAVYDEVVRRFGAAPEAALRELVSKAVAGRERGA